MEDVIQSCRLVAELALSCLGPCGRLKALQAASHTPAGVFTSSSGPLFEGLRASSPFVQLLASATAQAQCAEYGDGGLACAFLAARMAEAVIQESASRVDFNEGCQLLQAVGDKLQDLVHAGFGQGLVSDLSAPSVHCTNLAHYMALCRGVLAPKLCHFLDASEVEMLIALVAEAFIMSLPDKLPGSIMEPSQIPVTFQILPGGPIDDSCILAGVVFAAEEIVKGMSLVTEHESQDAAVGIVLVAEALDLRNSNKVGQQDTSFGAYLTENTDFGAPGEAEEQELQQLLQGLERILALSGEVQFLLCQKGIHPVVQEWLACKGISSAQRLGTVRVSKLSQISGCIPVACLADTHASVAGRVRAHLKVISGRKYQLFQPSYDQPMSSSVCTLMLACPSEALEQHLRTAVQCSLKLLHATLYKLPEALPGAGVFEYAAAQYLLVWAHDKQGLTALQEAVLAAIISALNHIAARINCKYPGGHLSSLQSNKPRCAEHFLDNTPHSILDSKPCKMASVHRAIFTAIQLSRLACQRL